MLPSLGSLDGGVEGQEVSLTGDVLDDGHRISHFIVHGLDSGHTIGHRTAACAPGLRRSHRIGRVPSGSLHVCLHLFHSGLELEDGRSDRLGHGMESFPTLSNRLSGDGHLVGGGGEFCRPASNRHGGAGHTVQGSPQVFDGLVERTTQVTDLILEVHLSGHGQVAQGLLASPAPDNDESAPASATESVVKAMATPAAELNPRGRRGRKPSATAASSMLPKFKEKAVTVPAPKQIRQPRKVKSAEADSAPTVAAQPTPIKASAPASASVISPVKEAVLSDISHILSNPGLSDSQAKALHSLFTYLALNALLGA